MHDAKSLNRLYKRWRQGEEHIWPVISAGLKDFLKDNICDFFPHLNASEQRRIQDLSPILFDELFADDADCFSHKQTFFDACAFTMRTVLNTIAKSSGYSRK